MSVNDRRNRVGRKWVFWKPRAGIVLMGFLFGTTFLFSLILTVQVGLAERILYVDNFDGFILRANVTDNQSSFVAFLLGENFSANIAPISFAFSNSTFSNATIGYKDDFSGRCDSSFSGAIDGKNQSHNMYYCKFIVPNEWSEGNYNLTFSLNDSFGDSYSRSAEFKFVKNLISTKSLSFTPFDFNVSKDLFLDSSNGTNVSVKMKFNRNVGTSALSVALYNKTPFGIGAYDPFNTSQFVELVPNWKNMESIYGWKDYFWAEIRIHYKLVDIVKIGLTESSLKLQSYNETTGKWGVCSGSSVNTTAKYVFCNSTHFSTWSITGDPIPSTPPQESSSQSSGGGGGSSWISSAKPEPFKVPIETGGTALVEELKWSDKTVYTVKEYDYPQEKIENKMISYSRPSYYTIGIFDYLIVGSLAFLVGLLIHGNTKIGVRRAR